MFGMKLYLLWHIRVEHMQIWVDNKLYCHELLLFTTPSSEQYYKGGWVGRLDCAWQLKTKLTQEEKVSWRSGVLIARVWAPDEARYVTRWMDWALRREVVAPLVACTPNLYPSYNTRNAQSLILDFSLNICSTDSNKTLRGLRVSVSFLSQSWIIYFWQSVTSFSWGYFREQVHTQFQQW